jgi:hypothetical protein
MYVNLFVSPFSYKNSQQVYKLKVQTEHMHLVLVETDEQIVAADRAVGICIKPGEDTLLVVCLVSSQRRTIVCLDSACMHMLH